MEDFYEDYGSTKEVADAFAWDEMEALEWEEEVTEWKLTIHQLSDEKENDDLEAPGYPAATRGVYTYAEIIYSLKEYDGDVGYWRRIESYETAKIWESDELLWAMWFMDWDYGVEFQSRRTDVWYPQFFVATDLDWDQVAREMLDIVDVKYSRLERFLSVDEVEIQHFLGKKQVGIWTELNYGINKPALEDDIESFESISKYNDDGVLYYYEYTYDGDTIAKFELKGMQGYNTYITENWWWMSIVAAAAVVGVIILICVIIKKRD